MSTWSSVPASGSGAEFEDLDTPALENHRYREGLLLGEGGMGTVHSIEDRLLDRLVARKVVRRAVPGAEARLLREARITARLAHPGVVPVHDVGHLEDGRLFYTMRLISGRTLAQARGALSTAAVVRHVLDVCRTIAFAHRQGVLHRDLKSANVLVGPFGETQVADWGLAAEISEHPRGRVGTPGFMSPEAESGDLMTAASDIWSLGALLRDVLDDGPPELMAVAERAQAPLPIDRYDSALEMASDIEAWLDGRPVAAYPYSSAEVLRRVAWEWRTPIGVGIFAALVVVVAGIAVVAQTRAERDRAQAARAQAERSEAAALLARSLDALEAHDRPRAELLAARSLILDPTPEARGVLAAWHGTPRPHLESTRPLDCDRVVWSGEPTCFRDGVVQIADHLISDVLSVHDLGSDRLALVMNNDVVVSVSRRTPETVVRELPVFAGRMWFDGLNGIRVGQGVVTHFSLETGAMRTETQCVDSLPQGANFDVHGRTWVVCSNGEVWVAGERQHAIPLDEGFPHVVEPMGEHALIGTLHGGVFHTEKPSPLRLFDGAIGSIHPSPDGTRALVRRVTGDAAVVDLERWRVETRIPGRIDDVQWLDSERLRTLGDADAIWSIPRSVPVAFPGSEGVSTVTLGRTHLAIGRGDGTLERVDRATGASSFVGRDYVGVLKHAAYDPTGEQLLFHGQDPNEVGIVGPDGVRTWPVRGSARVFWLDGAPGWVPYAAPIEVGEPDSPVRQFPAHRFIDLDPRGPILLGRHGEVHRLGIDAALGVVKGAKALSLQGETALVAVDQEIRTLDGTVVWDLGTDVPVELLATETHMIVGLMDGRVRVREVGSDHDALVLDGHRARVGSMSIRDGVLLTGSWDGTARRWDLGVLDVSTEALHQAIAQDWTGTSSFTSPALDR